MPRHTKGSKKGSTQGPGPLQRQSHAQPAKVETQGDDTLAGWAAGALTEWFPKVARELPWRKTPRQGYEALVSEAMLQQTQVSRVIPAFERFMTRFPTVQALAEAPEGDVLALWSGLGYYRRAKSLHAAAKRVMADFGGEVPFDVDKLLTLPGVGRYTAGAISSIAFNRPAPIVDGNVKRVLLRLHGRDLDPADKGTERWTWEQAGELVAAADAPAFTNEGLMELGATVCLPPPGKPLCLVCPLRDRCIAARDGLTDKIPRAKTLRKPTELYCVSLVLRDAKGRVLLEQRPAGGMWASMWQLPTIESREEWPSHAEINGFAQMRGGHVTLGAVAKPVGEFTHQTTHRTVRFRVVQGQNAACVRKNAGRVWAAEKELEGLGISNAQRKILRMIRGGGAV